MKRHIEYLKYIARHKLYVWRVGRILGVGRLAALHDNSKFLPGEWFPYARFFYNEDGSRRIDQPADVKAAFKRAWLAHQKRNKHHWQYWVTINDQDPNEALPMPRRYILEMLADWYGAGKAITGEGKPWNWYKFNADKMILYPVTRYTVEVILALWEQAGEPVPITIKEFHRWSGWPGAICQDCFIEDSNEMCLADGCLDFVQNPDDPEGDPLIVDCDDPEHAPVPCITRRR